MERNGCTACRASLTTDGRLFHAETTPASSISFHFSRGRQAGVQIDLWMSFLLGSDRCFSSYRGGGFVANCLRSSGNECWQLFRLRPPHTFPTRWAMYTSFRASVVLMSIPWLLYALEAGVRVWFRFLIVFLSGISPWPCPMGQNTVRFSRAGVFRSSRMFQLCSDDP